MITRVAIVNRGEAAMRLIHAVRELNAREGTSIETIALYTESERTAMFVREADHAHPLGPASARPYLDHAVLEKALVSTGADAAWVGWGFVAEDASFAELCDRLGVTFVGPTAQAMRTLGDKIGAKRLAESVGVPVATWSNGPVETLDEATEHARRIGYPLMLKAAAGGGGRGIRVLTSDTELAAVFDRTRDEARRAFGSDVVFLERLVTGARHVEVQLMADGQGGVWALGVRDCSVQRRNQKLIEESASPVLDAEQASAIKDAAARLALAVGYRGAGTAEFLYQPQERSFAFLEVNTRLQVEHPVTELVTDTDLVALQLQVAAGRRLEGPPPAETGHAVEARLNAEDPDRDFAPAPGRVALLRLPVGPGVRVDTGFAEGDLVPADFDSMIAKIIAYGATRAQALARLERALTDTTVVLEGGTTNKAFLLELLDRPEVRGNGQTSSPDEWADTGWIDRERTVGGLNRHRHSGVAVVAAAIDAYAAAEHLERQRFFTTAHGGRPQARHEVGRTFALKLRGTTHQVETAQVGPDRYRVAVDGRTVDATLERQGRFAGRLTVSGRTYRVVTASHGAEHQIEVDRSVHRVTQDEGGVVRAPAPALVVSVPVAPGAEVTADAPVIVLESMKMETVLTAPFAGRLRELLVATNDQVDAGQPLLRLEPLSSGDDNRDGVTPSTVAPSPHCQERRLELPPAPAPASPRESLLHGLGELRSLVLGFDLAPEDGRRQVAEYRAHRAEVPEDDAEVLAAETEVLQAFADICELSRNRPAVDDGPDDRVHSPREFFHRYLHSLDPERECLPAQFRDKLTRVLARYRVDDLARTPQLEEAVFRAFLSQQRAASHVPVVTALLQRWLVAEAPTGSLAARAREVLDRLVLATQLRYPSVGDLARSTRFHWFVAPTAEAARRANHTIVREQLAHLAHLADSPERTDERSPERTDERSQDADRAARIATLATVPGPIVRFLAEAIDDGAPTVPALLEALAVRQYYPHPLHDLTCSTTPAGPLLTADYEIDTHPSRLFSAAARFEDLPAVFEKVTAAIAVGTDRQPVVDLYVSWDDTPPTHDGCSRALAELLAGHPFAYQARRCAITVSARRGERIERFTFRPGTYGERKINEDTLVRGLHPMIGRRLDLWRLRDFRITRVDAPGDVLLYRCVAPDNPSDVRLVALAQVRELTVVRDARGRVTGLPQAERTVASCRDAIRRARAADPAGSRLDTNHVWVTIWPVIEAPVSELTALAGVVAPLTVGAGVEEVVAQARIIDPATPDAEPREVSAKFFYSPGAGVVAQLSGPPTERLRPLDDYAQKVVRSRRRGTVYPYELVPQLARGGEFVELDLDPVTGRMVPVERPPGSNDTGLVVGLVTTPTPRYPEGLTRVVLLGDPTKALGAVAEDECARLVAALDEAEHRKVPVEWFALSAGARISMANGTENMDWVARGLRRIIEFTQGGGEINVVVAGINVGAQPYWNAEATMLMHTKGILVMTPDSAMVLTGKRSLDYSGGVSAEDNFGIGGYDRVMGPNGQAQYWAADLAEAIDVLFAHYEHAYVAKGERFPRPARTSDPRDRDIRAWPHDVPDSDFRTVGDIFSPVTNPERKKPFDIRTLLQAVSDTDHPTLERWAGMADAETAVVLDAHLGGYPVCLVGIESRPVARRGFPPSDGPDTWTAGTLFPRSSKKTARAINAASGSRPVVVLANLSGFDGSPESMRTLQLEYGAEIGRAIANFDGPIVFCVVSRYHGGAFVVFSKALNDNLTVLAVEGSYASVIGGAPAAAVVFTGEVETRTGADPRLTALERRLARARDVERARLRSELTELRAAVRSEKLGEVASEFDSIHSIERAVKVGSVDAVVAAHELRPRLIEAVESGLAKALQEQVRPQRRSPDGRAHPS
jgi:acetyl/propionyl-CoA carboxylase alpha subunit/acetyl-CoA carboxylase carboxyltransferase component